MRYLTLARSIRRLPTHYDITGPLQSRFRPKLVPADPKPKKYKLPATYDPYGPRPPPSDKIIQLAEKIAALPPEERRQISPVLREILGHPKMQSTPVEQKVEKITTFDIKLEKYDAADRIKVIKEVRALTSLNLKEVKDMVDSVPIVIKQGVYKDEADEMIEKIKAAGGVAVMCSYETTFS
uniref:50S ribosomal protein L7/L12-like n=1 Tax=Erigeron canadensis TaxID=72917 RepID=UPI001CB8C3D7|nr:50S ribosomal protein L7/L12-like [Erigeron canadensis]XP_043637408.1 50S ribosomal protein L7/L12-like [Erigeron canadensis]